MLQRNQKNNTLVLIQTYSWLKDIRRHFFPICKLLISPSSKMNMDCCDHSTDFTRAATRREMKGSSQLLLRDAKAMCVPLQVFFESRPTINVNRPVGLLQFNTNEYTGGPRTRWAKIIRTRTRLLPLSDVVLQKFDMGTWRVCFKCLKFNVLWIKLTYLAILSYSLLFHGVWGRFEVFWPALTPWRRFKTASNTKSHVRVRFIYIIYSRAWAACDENSIVSRLVHSYTVR